MSQTANTVLVTGGAGFIGSAIVRTLIAQGRRVVVLDDLSTGTRANLADLPAGQLTNIFGHIGDRPLVAELLKRVDAVVHMACINLRRSLVDPEAAHRVNATATLHLLEAVRDVRLARFVHVSTSEVYGTARTVPMREDHPTEPTTAYGASKLAGEAYVRAYATTYGLPAVILRPFNAYGPRCHHEGDSGEVIPRFMLRAMAGRELVVFGDGTQTRDFSYVEDTARAIAAALDASNTLGETINIGAGQEFSIAEVATRVAAACGVAAPRIDYAAVRPGDVRRLCADVAKGDRLLGSSARIGFDEGLTRLAAWYRAQGRSAEELLRSENLRSWEKASAA